MGSRIPLFGASTTWRPSDDKSRIDWGWIRRIKPDIPLPYVGTRILCAMEALVYLLSDCELKRSILSRAGTWVCSSRHSLLAGFCELSTLMGHSIIRIVAFYHGSAPEALSLPEHFISQIQIKPLISSPIHNILWATAYLAYRIFWCGSWLASFAMKTIHWTSYFALMVS